VEVDFRIFPGFMLPVDNCNGQRGFSIFPSQGIRAQADNGDANLEQRAEKSKFWVILGAALTLEQFFNI
jgi:hypothetical protein